MREFDEIRERHVAAARGFTGEAVARLGWSRDRVIEAQTLGLRKVVGHAQEHSVFFAERLGGLEASTLELSDLVKIPPMTKATVMEHWDDMVTDPRLKLEDVVSHLERLHRGEDENPYLLGEYYAAASGGTSGKRGVYLWDWESFVVTANITYRLEVQRDLVAPPTGPRRTAVVCAGSYVHASRFLFPTSLDAKREVRVFPAGMPLAQMVEEMNAYQPDRLVGYASIVQELCALALDGELKISLNRIMTNSEPLYPEAREMAREAWGIDIHNSWGSVELGLAAMEGESFGGVSLAEDFLIFEPVDADDKPVSDPSSADRVLGTKLFGSVMPMIRYEMTDTMVFDLGENPDAPGCRRITEIKGRADNWFVYGRSLKIHPMIFRSVLGQGRHISEYQVQQTEKGALVLAIAHGAFEPGGVKEALRGVLEEAGLEGAEVTVEVVSDLPRHAQTNKLKRFVPL
jgi:phenylacetate-CoA ligase